VKGWSIKWRVIVLALAPMLLLALVLTGYFSWTRIQDMQQALRDRGQSIARELAPAAEYGLFTNSREALRELAASVKADAQGDADVRLVTISDHTGQLLASSGDLKEREVLSKRPEGIGVGLLEYPNRLYFREPIRRPLVRLDDPGEQPAAEAQPRGARRDNVVGWVNVTMSKDAIVREQQSLLIASGLITLAAFFFTALAALRTGRGIVRPLRRLTAAVEQITQGDLSTQVAEKGVGEVARLTRGVNSMAGSLRTARENLEEKVRSATEQLAFQATHDTLTGLINRREFEARLAGAHKSAKQDGNVHALLFLDLDQFKIVNDTCGHGAGDEMLSQITQQFRQKIRESDTLARIGGDEFTVLLENCNLDDAVEVAQGLREAAQNFRFAWEDKVFAVGACVGIVMITHAAESPAALLSQADSACYTAKDLGRNRIYVFSEDDSARHARVGAMQWVTRINHAFQENRFVLYCQSILPLQDAKEGDPYLYEILLRMRGENGEIVLPMAFVPAAERFNLMQAIDRWVIHESLSILKRILSSGAAGASTTSFSINLSGPSLCDERFSGFLQEQLVDLDIPPRNVYFEVTETAAISNLTHAVNLIQHFKRMGCRFLLDDFGAGLSSFNYLKHLPIDGIKIDGGFVKGMMTNRMDLTMVEAINNIGHAMGLTTTAEFVEDDAIMRKLLELGVDYAQGNWVHRPRALEEWFATDIETRRTVDHKLRVIAGKAVQR
jgi:diguanylate cyclase (GGDEF)-like protein